MDLIEAIELVLDQHPDERVLRVFENEEYFLIELTPPLPTGVGSPLVSKRTDRVEEAPQGIDGKRLLDSMIEVQMR